MKTENGFIEKKIRLGKEQEKTSRIAADAGGKNPSRGDDVTFCIFTAPEMKNLAVHFFAKEVLIASVTRLPAKVGGGLRA